MSRIRVLIADDHAVVREGLSLVVGSEPDMLVAAMASDGHEAVLAAREHKPQVAILDMRMPKLGGIAAIRALREQCPETKILVLSMYDDERIANAARQAGAHGYVGKQAPSSTVVRAIRSVHRGERLSQEAEREAESGESMELSTREREVMELLVVGHTSRSIADQLGITKSSVDTYRARVFQKLGVADRVELLAHVAGLHRAEAVAGEL